MVAALGGLPPPEGGGGAVCVVAVGTVMTASVFTTGVVICDTTGSWCSVAGVCTDVVCAGFGTAGIREGTTPTTGGVVVINVGSTVGLLFGAVMIVGGLISICLNCISNCPKWFSP